MAKWWMAIALAALLVPQANSRKKRLTAPRQQKPPLALDVAGVLNPNQQPVGGIGVWRRVEAHGLDSPGPERPSHRSTYLEAPHKIEYRASLVEQLPGSDCGLTSGGGEDNTGAANERSAREDSQQLSRGHQWCRASWRDGRKVLLMVGWGRRMKSSLNIVFNPRSISCSTSSSYRSSTLAHSTQP